MTRLLLALLLATPLLAQNADLSISAAPAGAVFHTQPAEVAIVVANAGPDRATNVVVDSVQALDDRIDPRCARVEAGFRCVADAVEPGTSVTFRARTGSHSSVRPMRFDLTVRSDQADPNPANNSYLLLADWLDQSSAEVTVSAPPALDAQKRGTVRVSFENRSGYAATDAKLLLRVTSLARVIAVDPALSCTTGVGQIVCALPAVAAHSTFEAAFEIELLLETLIFYSASVEWGDLGFEGTQFVTHFRDFDVTTTADSGPGSLRQAIIDANALCTINERACRIRFLIAEPPTAEGWYTIQPRTPLPEVTAPWMLVDGRTQTDVHPDRPEVFLDGSAVNADGPGLSLGTYRTGVYGLAIGNFRGNGISIRTGDQHVIQGNFLGVDPTGSRAAPNGGRGVEVLSGFALVEHNVLSGNGRSGAFLWCRNVQVTGNRIGVAAHSDEAIGNGASGIFIGPRGTGYGRAAVTENVIANNRDFGVALGIYAVAVVERNRIFNNVQGGIDIGLDGPTVDAPASAEIPAPPTILSVRFDGTATIIEGFTRAGSANNVVATPRAVELYANTAVDGQGFAEGERLLGTATMNGLSFTLRHEGDLRGSWITGIARQRSSYFSGEYEVEATSEFSRPVKAE
ncbi:MAG TPA: right-handed parallel beta-helix repeat-containing protein [Thermoanaerobaculia bacterium]|nr:right-handed parallel beta-helix repeat-containing protein [Thermoanaerobaculia bacterium]